MGISIGHGLQTNLKQAERLDLAFEAKTTPLLVISGIPSCFMF
jgi:hypothetical protein